MPWARFALRKILQNKNKAFFWSLLCLLLLIGGVFFAWHLSTRNQNNDLGFVHDLTLLKGAGKDALENLRDEKLESVIANDGAVLLAIDAAVAPEGSNPIEPVLTDQFVNNQIAFPTSYADPIRLNIGAGKDVSFSDADAKNFLPVKTENGKVISYKSKDGRKTVYYAKSKNAQDESPTLKNWVTYTSGNGNEKETYRFENVILKEADNGDVHGFFYAFSGKDEQGAAAQVEGSLMERARMVIGREAKEDILSQKNRQPDFILPKPFFIDKNGKRRDLVWSVADDALSVSVTIETLRENYPLALDPTITFTNPGQSGTQTGIVGEALLNQFGYVMTSGDFNADGRTDLVVGASGYSTNIGRVYIFYNDGSISTTAANADVIITGEGTSNYFGRSLIGGDFNADGRTDLAVGANGYSSSAGRVYVFYMDRSVPPTVATAADVIITGEAGSEFGSSLTSGDFNADGKIDLTVGARIYSTNMGRVYIFYGSTNFGDPNANNATGGIITMSGGYKIHTFTSAGTFIPNNVFNVEYLVVAGGGSGNLGGPSEMGGGGGGGGGVLSGTGKSVSVQPYSIVIGSGGTGGGNGGNSIFDSITAVGGGGGGGGFTSGTSGGSGGGGGWDGDEGSTYGGAGTAGQGNAGGNAYFDYPYYGNLGGGGGGAGGVGQTAGVVYGGAGGVGIASSISGTAVYYGGGGGGGDNYNGVTSGGLGGGGNGGGNIGGSAGVPNTGGGGGGSVISPGGSGGSGIVIIRYVAGTNTIAATAANVIITGQASSSFGTSVVSGDFNADGKTDLAVGADGYSVSTGRAYIFYNDGSIPTTAAAADVIITGEGTSNSLGFSLTSGDFNADGKTDLAVGARDYSSGTGRAYIFYNDGSIPTTAATADVIIAGEATGNYFGTSLIGGDFNFDGKTDLAIGASGYSSAAGRAYIFYNDGSIPTTGATADGIITGGEASSWLGCSLVSGDFNADGRMDLAMGAFGYSSTTGKVSIAYSFNGIFDSNASLVGDVTSSALAGNYFGTSLASGDFNADGKTDLAVGATGYSSNAGRVYIFYNDGSIPTAATTADVIITGETSSQFGSSLASGDLNADGKTDLAVGSNASPGRTWIFYNDGSIPTTAATADVIITGEASSTFGSSIVSGDFNADGKTDLAVGANGYSVSTGRAYIFYNDGSIPTTAATADVIIAGEASSAFGYRMTAGDFNADGKTDLAVTAVMYSTSTGRTYIFYNDGSIPTTAATADVVITGEGGQFGYSLTSGDFNADGRVDLAVGANVYAPSIGRAYIFYNDGSIPTTAATADVIIDGEAVSNLGFAMTAGDFNADGKTDLAVSGIAYSSNTGRVYIFYNDGSISTTAANADVIITGEGTLDYFGWSLIGGDFNADGKTDLAVGAYQYSSNSGVGRTYIFTNDGSIPAAAASADNTINGDLTFSTAPLGATKFVTGDFNTDGKTDLAVGAYTYSSDKGRVYLFYNDGTYPTKTANADATITGESATNYFGYSLVGGDFNADGKTDLAVGAYGYSSNTGRTYIFYGDGFIPTSAAAADIITTGETTTSYFGISLAGGDFNADSRTDLAVGANGYSSNAGRVYILTNDGSIPTTAATADVITTGDVTNNTFGSSLASGDLNADGKTDLAVGSNASPGRTWIFYNDGSIPTTAATADVIITGEASSTFGSSIVSGDFNADGKTDLAVGASGYSSGSGRVYIFTNDGSYPATAATADVIITGEAGSNFLGKSLTANDFNADGKIDLAVGAFNYSSGVGRAYIFMNDGSIPTTAAAADVIITGSVAGATLGSSLGSGDINNDGKADLIVGTGTGEAVYFMFTGVSGLDTAPYDEKIGSDVKMSGNIKFSMPEECGANVSAGEYCRFGGITYGFVAGADGKVWMDRNLGAKQVAASATDQNAYGWLYQWGRGSDGHQYTAWGAQPDPALSGSTAALAASDTPGHGLFITKTTSPYDWRNPQNGNLWQGINGVNNPCPPGFRLPTGSEWAAWVSAAGVTNAATAYASTLKLPLAGARFYNNASLTNQGLSSGYWSSSVISINSHDLVLSASSADPAGSVYRGTGLSVRCVKN